MKWCIVKNKHTYHKVHQLKQKLPGTMKIVLTWVFNTFYPPRQLKVPEEERFEKRRRPAVKTRALHYGSQVPSAEWWPLRSGPVWHDLRLLCWHSRRVQGKVRPALKFPWSGQEWSRNDQRLDQFQNCRIVSHNCCLYCGNYFCAFDIPAIWANLHQLAGPCLGNCPCF